MPMFLQRFYGFKRTPDGGFEIVEEEAEVIRYIAKRYMDGLGFTRIAKELNDMEIKSPSGQEWHYTGVRSVLTNEKNAGDMILQKRFVQDHISKKRVANTGQLNMYYLEENHKGILSKELYESILKEMKRREKQGNHKYTETLYPFRGIIRCGKCGANYRRKVGNSSTKYGKPAWNCATFLTKGKAVCHTKQIPEEELYRLSCEVLGLTDFDKHLFKEKIKEIIIPEWNVITFVFYNGETITTNWNDRSRKWTDEMKAENYDALRRRHA